MERDTLIIPCALYLPARARVIIITGSTLSDGEHSVESIAYHYSVSEWYLVFTVSEVALNAIYYIRKRLV